MTHVRIVAVGDPPVFRQQVAQAVEIPAESIEWMPSLNAADEMFGAHGDEADVLVISPTVGEEDVLALAQLAGRFSPTTAVVLVRDGSQGANGRLPSYMRAGIRDVCDLEQGDDLAEALHRAMQWSSNLKSSRGEEVVSATETGKIMTVFSSKGGTGKTFLATNLAAAFAQKTQKDTAIVDLDFTMGDVFSYFGREAQRPVQDLLDPEMKLDLETMMSAATQLGGTLHGFGSPPDPGAAEVPAEDVSGLLRLMRKTFTHTVIDTPAGYTDQILPALDFSDQVLLIASLDVVGIKHLAKAIDTLASIGLPTENLFVVLNRANSKVGLDIEDVERVTKIKIDAMIPSSILVPTSLNHGHPVVLEEPRSDVADAVNKLADKLMKPGSAMGAREQKEQADAQNKGRFRLRRGSS